VNTRGLHRISFCLCCAIGPRIDEIRKKQWPPCVWEWLLRVVTGTYWRYSGIEERGYDIIQHFWLFYWRHRLVVFFAAENWLNTVNGLSIDRGFDVIRFAWYVFVNGGFYIKGGSFFWKVPQINWRAYYWISAHCLHPLLPSNYWPKGIWFQRGDLNQRYCAHTSAIPSYFYNLPVSLNGRIYVLMVGFWILLPIFHQYQAGADYILRLILWSLLRDFIKRGFWRLWKSRWKKGLLGGK